MIYLFKHGNVSWDEFEGFVVAAESPEQAVKMVNERDWTCFWTEEECVLLDNTTSAGIVLESYNAG